ncbi:unnamed protein product, partial [Durusdinium trenchii]
MSPVIHDPTGVASTVPCVQVMNLPEDSEEAHEVSQQEAGRNVGRTSNMGGDPDSASADPTAAAAPGEDATAAATRDLPQLGEGGAPRMVPLLGLQEGRPPRYFHATTGGGCDLPHSLGQDGRRGHQGGDRTILLHRDGLEGMRPRHRGAVHGENGSAPGLEFARGHRAKYPLERLFRPQVVLN